MAKQSSVITINFESNGKIMTSVMSPNVFYGKFNSFVENKTLNTDLYATSFVEVNSLVFQLIKNIENEYNSFIFNKIAIKSAITSNFNDSLKNLPFNEFLDSLFDTEDSMNTLIISADNKNRKLNYYTHKLDDSIKLKDDYLVITVKY